MLDDVVAIGKRCGEAEILFDEKDRKPLPFERADDAPDLLDDDRGEPLGRLVEQQEPGAGAQDAADRQHLLLAAREFCSLALAPLVEVGKEAIDLVEAQAAR